MSPQCIAVSGKVTVPQTELNLDDVPRLVMGGQPAYRVSGNDDRRR